MKRNYFICVLLILLLSFTSCTKKSDDGNAMDKNSVKKDVVAEKVVTVNPEIEKLNSVLDSMTDYFKAEVIIPEENKEAFLMDLHFVLDAEKNHPQDEESLYILVDKTHKIGPEVKPTHITKLVENDAYVINKTTLSLRTDVEAALREMALAAKEAGVTLTVSSTYRSYEQQVNTFNYWVSIDGEEVAETYSARPGTSQHQLGTVIDFGCIEDEYALTDEYKWLIKNCEDYGWSLSFPKDYDAVTGYKWESWHYRYIGREACAFQNKWFNDIQQYMLEFIDAWKKVE